MRIPIAEFATRSLPLAFALFALAACNSGNEPRVVVPPPVMDGDSVRFRADSPQVKVLRSEPVTEQNRESIKLPARLVWDESQIGRAHV